MPGARSTDRYAPLAQALHWLTALLVLGLIAVGLWMVALPIGFTKLYAYGWHKWIGLTIMVLTLVRLAWRWRHPPPPLPLRLARWERVLAPAAHALLYLLLLAMPLSGWLMTSAAGLPVFWFGLFQVPDLVGRDPQLFELFRATHHWLSRAVILLLAIHIGAVLRHDVLRRDGVLRRMWPFAT